MNKGPLLSLVVAVLLAAGATRAVAGGFVTGNTLWAYCKEDAPGLFCMGYVSGVADMVDASAKSKEAPGFRACFRDHTTISQITDVVKLWLQNHPDKRDYVASGLVGLALQDAFPCPP